MAFIPSFYSIRVAGAPLPQALLQALGGIEVDTSLEEAAMFRLRFEMSQTVFGDWDVLQLDLFRPRVPVTISVGLGRFVPETLINGYVREARIGSRSQPGASTLEVVGTDATAALMNDAESPMPYPNLQDSVIAAIIFARYGMVPLAFPPTPAGRTVRDVTTSQRISDIRFLKELAERNGYECYVQPDPIAGQDVGHFHPPQSALPAQGVLSTNFGLATNLDNFDVNYDMLQPTTATATQVDPDTRRSQPAAALAAQEQPMGREPTLARILPTAPSVRPARTFAANPAELRAVSQAIVDRSSRALRGSGEVDGLKYAKVLRPGQPVAVRGAGREYSGNYYVTQVSHSISTSHYTQRFDAWRNALGLTGAEQFVDSLAALD